MTLPRRRGRMNRTPITNQTKVVPSFFNQSEPSVCMYNLNKIEVDRQSCLSY